MVYPSHNTSPRPHPAPAYHFQQFQLAFCLLHPLLSSCALRLSTFRCLTLRWPVEHFRHRPNMHPGWRYRPPFTPGCYFPHLLFWSSWWQCHRASARRTLSLVYSLSGHLALCSLVHSLPQYYGGRHGPTSLRTYITWYYAELAASI